MARKGNLKMAALSEFYLIGIDKKKRQSPLFWSQESKRKRGKRKSERFPFSRLLLNTRYSSDTRRRTLRTENSSILLLDIPSVTFLPASKWSWE